MLLITGVEAATCFDSMEFPAACGVWKQYNVAHSTRLSSTRACSTLCREVSVSSVWLVSSRQATSARAAAAWLVVSAEVAPHRVRTAPQDHPVEGRRRAAVCVEVARLVVVC